MSNLFSFNEIKKGNLNGQFESFFYQIVFGHTLTNSKHSKIILKVTFYQYVFTHFGLIIGFVMNGAAAKGFLCVILFSLYSLWYLVSLILLFSTFQGLVLNKATNKMQWNKIKGLWILKAKRIEDKKQKERERERSFFVKL